jgi:hypothetical protein
VYKEAVKNFYSIDGMVAMNKAAKMPKAKRIVETKAVDQCFGLGEETVKIIDADVDQVICFIAKKNDEDQIYFPKPASLAEIEAVVELLQRKKFNRFMNEGEIEKAQEYANRKFHIG